MCVLLHLLICTAVRAHITFEALYKINYYRPIQTHRRFKRMLFIRTKHNMQIFSIIPFIKPQNDISTNMNTSGHSCFSFFYITNTLFVVTSKQTAGLPAGKTVYCFLTVCFT